MGFPSTQNINSHTQVTRGCEFRKLCDQFLEELFLSSPVWVSVSQSRMMAAFMVLLNTDAATCNNTYSYSCATAT